MYFHPWQDKEIWHYKGYVIWARYVGTNAFKAIRITTGQHMIVRVNHSDLAPHQTAVRKLVDRLEVYENPNKGYYLTGQICEFEGKQDFTFTGISFIEPQNSH